MASRKIVSLLRPSLLALCVAAATSIAQAEVFGINGGTGISAFAVSPDGSVVVGSRDSATGWEAFRWTQNG